MCNARMLNTALVSMKTKVKAHLSLLILLVNAGWLKRRSHGEVY